MLSESRGASIRKQTAVWTTREGQRLRLCDMADSHLLNTLRFLKRAVHAQEVALVLSAPAMNGEQAQYAQDQAFDEVMCEPEEHECAMPPIYDKMLVEAKRSGLTNG